MENKDKIQRVLGIYSKLQEGKLVNKAEEANLHEAAKALKTTDKDILNRIEQLNARIKEQNKELAKFKAQAAQGQVAGIMDKLIEVKGIKLIAAQVAGDANELREMADSLRDKIGSGVVVLGAVNDGSVQLVAAVTKDLAGKVVNAGNIIRETAKICGGGGGGRPDMAQAGGKDPSKLAEALDNVKNIL